MGIFGSIFGRKDPKTPVTGMGPRIKNIVKNNFRGILGTLVPILALSWRFELHNNERKIEIMWLLMIWLFLLQPVNIPVTGLIPIFFLPMLGVYTTRLTCMCYMNEGINLFIVGSMLILLLNNAGVDRRVAVWFLCSGSEQKYTARRLLFKCSTAAFFLSMFSSRLITTSILTDYVTPILQNLQSGTNRKYEPDFDKIRFVICNGIQTSSAIGSIAIIHASFATLTFRAIFYAVVKSGTSWPDIFNYFQYTVYAFPVALIMFILNLGYHMYLINLKNAKPMSDSASTSMKNSLMALKTLIPRKITFHEKLAVFFTIMYLVIFFTRWSKFLNKGWGEFRENKGLPLLKDATVAAMFVIILHTLPKSFGFTKYITAKKKSQLTLKPESAILWWRFVDRNMNYGYIFLIGSGVALGVVVLEKGMRGTISDNLGKQIFTDHTWNLSIFIVCLVAVVLANMMSGCAACVSFLPFVLSMVQGHELWSKRVYLGALGVGVGSSLGFMWPFLYTPAYFCHYNGKVPMAKMAKYSIPSVIICLVVLWLSLTFWAPIVWESDGFSIISLKEEEAPGGGGGGGGGPVETTTPPPLF